MCPSLGEIPAKLRQNSLKLLSSTSYLLNSCSYQFRQDTEKMVQNVHPSLKSPIASAESKNQSVSKRIK